MIQNTENWVSPPQFPIEFCPRHNDVSITVDNFGPTVAHYGHIAAFANEKIVKHTQQDFRYHPTPPPSPLTHGWGSSSAEVDWGGGGGGEVGSSFLRGVGWRRSEGGGGSETLFWEGGRAPSQRKSWAIPSPIWASKPGRFCTEQCFRSFFEMGMILRCTRHVFF